MEDKTYTEVMSELGRAIQRAVRKLIDAIEEVWSELSAYVLKTFEEEEKKESPSVSYWINPKHDARMKSQVLINKPKRVFARTNC